MTTEVLLSCRMHVFYTINEIWDEEVGNSLKISKPMFLEFKWALELYSTLSPVPTASESFGEFQVVDTCDFNMLHTYLIIDAWS